MMRKNKFKLGVFSYPGGDVYCNTAVMEHGDYKKIAFIDKEGNLRFDVPLRFLPVGIEDKMFSDARKQREKFLAWWNKQPENYRYEKLLDRAPLKVFLEVIGMYSIKQGIKFLEPKIFGKDISVQYCEEKKGGRG